MGEALEFDLHGIAAGGEGVGRADGLVVFAARTAIGDRVRAEVEPGKRFARVSRVEILRPSPDRVEPRCPHYTSDACGGCQLQHMNDGAQRSAKAAIIRDAFQRIAKREIPLPEIRHGASPWRYRTKLTLALKRTADGWTAGLHRYDDPAAVFALKDCLITDTHVMEVWHAVLAHHDLLPRAQTLRASVRLVEGGAALVVEGGAEWHQAQALFDAVRVLTAIWWIPKDGRRRLVAQGSSRQGDGASFAQVNAEVALLVRDHVLGLAKQHAPRRVIDAYSGSGDTAEPLARSGAQVIAIEVDHDASRVCASRLPTGSRAIAGSVEQALPRELPADLVLLNPPRAGVGAGVIQALDTAQPRPQTILYVSCDPGTLARDVVRLASYRVASVVGFDMFPQTAHVETVCELVAVDA